MESPSHLALLGFIAWTLLLLLWMEGIRSWLVLSRQVVANGFTPDNAGLSPFMQRLARAHANCLEGLPIFGGLLLLAIATEREAVTDGLAYALLLARLLQSIVHLASLSPAAVTVRFSLFAVQMGIAVWWVVGLLSS